MRPFRHRRIAVATTAGILAAGILVASPAATAATAPTITSVSPSVLPVTGGQTVTVDGSGFTSSTTLRLVPTQDVLTTVAGIPKRYSCPASAAPIPAATAELPRSGPYPTAVSASGTVYLSTGSSLFEITNGDLVPLDACGYGPLASSHIPGGINALAAPGTGSHTLYVALGGSVDIGGKGTGQVWEVNTATWTATLIAGNAPKGSPETGVPAATAPLDPVLGIAVDQAGVYISEIGPAPLGGLSYENASPGGNIIQFIPSASGTYYGQSMIAGDIYTIAGNGQIGTSAPANGSPASSTALAQVGSVAVDPTNGTVFFQTASTTVDALPAVSGTYFGESMNAGDLYAVFGDPNGYPNGENGENVPLYDNFGFPGDLAYVSQTSTAHANGLPAGLYANSREDIWVIPSVAETFEGIAMTVGDSYIVAGNNNYGWQDGVAPVTGCFSGCYPGLTSQGPDFSISPFGLIYIGGIGPSDIAAVGADFSAATSVGSVTEVNSGELTFTSPSLTPGVYDLEAVNGTSVSSPVTVDVSTPPSPYCMSNGLGGCSEPTQILTLSTSGGTAYLMGQGFGTTTGIELNGSTTPSTVPLVQSVQINGVTLPSNDWSVVAPDAIKLDMPAMSTGAYSVTVTGVLGSEPETTWVSYGSIGTLAVTAGSLSLATPSALSWSTSISPTTTVASDAAALTVIDATGSGAGWHITATSTPLVSGSHTLGTSGITVSGPSGGAPSATCATSSTCRPSTPTGIAYPVDVPFGSSTPTTIYAANAGSGLGAVILDSVWSVSVPPNSYAGDYTATITVSLVSGP